MFQKYAGYSSNYRKYFDDKDAFIIFALMDKYIIHNLKDGFELYFNLIDATKKIYFKKIES